MAEWGVGYLLLAPFLLGILVFAVWPFLLTVYLSFTHTGTFGPSQWIGLQNWQTMLDDPTFAQAFTNTVAYTALSVPASLVISLVVAALLNSGGRGFGVYRVIYFLPTIAMPTAVSLMWRSILNGDFGFANQMLADLGIQGPRWLAGPWELVSLVVVGVWLTIGFDVILFLAGLQTIPKMYLEAAEIDGAGPVRRFVSITLPLLSPTVFFATVISLISALQVFDLVYLLFPSSVDIGSITFPSLAYLYYRDSFVDGNRGYGSAIALLLVGLVLIVTMVQIRMQRRFVHYD